MNQIDIPFIDSIVCGDNVATMKQLPDECIDLTVTSPPYDDMRTYGGHAWDFESVARGLFRVTKKGGVVVWVVADATIDGSETGTSFRQALFFMETGFKLHDTMIWHKGSFSFPEATRYHPVFEYMFVFSKGAPKTLNLIKDRANKYAGTKVHGTGRYADGETRPHNAVSRGLDREYAKIGQRWNVWQIPNPGVVGSKHPAPFPKQLAGDHIISWSKEGDLVCDPFSGSGTTCKMAKYLGRHWLGIEVEPAYVEISTQRMAQEVLL